MRKPISFLLLLAMLLPASLQAEVLSTDTPPVETAAAEIKTETGTTAAKITSLEGDVRILKKDTSDWQTAAKDQTVEAGDQIKTGAGSSVDIAYDVYLLNITHIQENTKAEFKSINPTDIYLEDGTIFSALDGLEENGEYQIATPTAVAGVRGTHFDVSFDKENQTFSSASLPSGIEGHQSIIYIRDPKKPSAAPVVLMERKQMDLKSGQQVTPQRVQNAPAQRLEKGQQAFSQMKQRMPQFQERREQGLKRMEEKRNAGTQDQKGPGGPNGPNGPNNQNNPNGPNGPNGPQGPNGPGNPQQGPQQQGPQQTGMNNVQPRQPWGNNPDMKMPQTGMPNKPLSAPTDMDRMKPIQYQPPLQQSFRGGPGQQGQPGQPRGRMTPEEARQMQRMMVGGGNVPMQVAQQQEAQKWSAQNPQKGNEPLMSMNTPAARPPMGQPQRPQQGQQPQGQRPQGPPPQQKQQ